MIKRYHLKLRRFAISNVDFVVISFIFILTNIPIMIWEVYLVGVDWSDEWKVRLVSIAVDIVFATPYLYLRIFLIKEINIRNKSVKLYITDTLSILITYVILKSLKFFMFSKIGWISSDGLNIAIWSIVIFSIFFGRITGLILDRSHVYFQGKIKNFLGKSIGYALLRFGVSIFFIKTQLKVE